MFDMTKFNERRAKAEKELQARLAARTPEEVAAYEAAVAADHKRIADDQFHRMIVLRRKLEKEIRSHLRKCAPCKAENYCREANEKMDYLLSLEEKTATPNKLALHDKTCAQCQAALTLDESHECAKCRGLADGTLEHRCDTALEIIQEEQS